MKKFALLTAVLFASTAALAASSGQLTNECSTCKVKLNGTEIAKDASSPIKAGDKIEINGKTTTASATQAAQSWEVDSSGSLKASSKSSAYAAPSSPSAQPASAMKAAASPSAPATSNQ